MRACRLKAMFKLSIFLAILNPSLFFLSQGPSYCAQANPMDAHDCAQSLKFSTVPEWIVVHRSHLVTCRWWATWIKTVFAEK